MNKRLAPLRRAGESELLVHEVYRSVQGESTRAGLPCTFVRLAACELRCSWCDTPHAFTEGAPWTMQRILEEVERLQCPLVELTGGEPLLQPGVFPLIGALADRGYRVMVETSGGRDISPVDRRAHIVMDIKCPDSGEARANLWANLDVLKPTDEVKLVVASRRDFDWAADVVREHGLDRRFFVLVSPAYGRVEPGDLAAWLLDSGLQIRLQLQLHKQIWDPDARGV